MILLAIVGLLALGIIGSKLDKEWMEVVGYLLGGILAFVAIFGSLSMSSQNNTETDSNFIVTSSPSVTKVQHLVAEDTYVVHLSDGSSRYTETYDEYPNLRIIDSDDRSMDVGYHRLEAWNFFTPWEYHMPHADVLYFPASEIEVLP